MSARPGRGPSTVTTIDADGAHELVAEMRLVSISEPARLSKVLGTRATIGTSELADVRIEDRTASRLHCEITLEQGRARVRDLGSRNGTFVNGVEIQAALAKREVKRIGRNDYQAVDVRVIAATNRDLIVEVDRKAFRSDLYYRLAVLEVRVPPLRERLDDLSGSTGSAETSRRWL